MNTLKKVRRRWRAASLAALVVAATGVVAAVGVTGASAATIDTSAWYQLVSRHSGKAIDVCGASTADGACIQQWSRANQANQQFQFVDSGGGYYRIKARHSGKVIDIYAKSTADGANVVQWSDNGGTNQQFRVVDSDSGYVRFINRNSGKALDVWEWSTADGGRISQYTDLGGYNQQWQLIKVDGGTNPPAGDALYVAPNGSDSASGTQSNPTTLTSAITRVAAGGTIYLRGGTYNYSQTVTIAAGNNGTSSARKTLSAYPGETPVLNFSAQSENSANRGLAVNGNYWHVYGIVVQRAGDNGIFVGGSNNIIERTITRFNHDTGLQISRISSTTPRDQWPANNLVLSAESHDNADTLGENADGFAAKLTVGPGNVFRYAVSHNNIDDGWDLYTKTDTGPIDSVTIEDSLAYNNGTLTDGTQNVNGDRNGYKLGGSDIAVNHIVRRSIAYHNGKHGFTYNSNPGTMSISNNLSIDNNTRNFSWDAGTSVFRNNTSCRFNVNGSNDKTIGDADSSNQFWTGSNGSRCSSYTGSLGWSFASDGRLVVTFGGNVVTL